MVNKQTGAGLRELQAARRNNRRLFWAVGLFSVFANLLMLTGPVYMLQVYDRVLGSGSVATLVALTTLVAFLYGIMGALDFTRGQIMARAGARFQAGLERRVLDAVVRKSAGHSLDPPASGLRDLEAVQRVMISPVIMALFDAPWVPVFLLGIALFHPWLGYLALGGGAVLVLLTLAHRMTTKTLVTQLSQAQTAADTLSNQIRSEAATVQSLGLRDAMFDRWQQASDAVLHRHLGAADLGAGFGAASKSLRLFLQSAMLGLGAWLVIRGEVSAGAMIAASILLGRALAPIEQVIGQWALVQRAVQGWSDLAQLLSDVPPESPRTTLPVPRARLDVQGLTVIPPGANQPVLRLLSFAVGPGQAVGVIGPTGAGKSTLARALTGAWPAVAGKVRLDGAALDHYAPAALGQHIGYLPQRVQLFDGTIAENIARMTLTPDAAQVVAAARKAAAHEMILNLPHGYDTQVCASDGRLSGGQIQRIGLARAMYGDPVILVLDEPNSNLDNEGSEALNTAIRTMKAVGRSVLIMAHRPAALQECDMILVLDGGTCAAFGRKDEVLRRVLDNHEAVQTGMAQGRGGRVR